MGKVRLTRRILRLFSVFFTVAFIAGCNFWGVDDLTVKITSPTGDVTVATGQSIDFQCEVTFEKGTVSYQWDFGGGATNSTVQNPGSTTFSTTGTYTVNLSVTDSSGATADTSVVVTVQSSTAATWTKISAGQNH